MIFKCAGITDSMNDGIGISLDIFFQGCSMRCKNCQNSILQDFEGGSLYNTNDIINHIKIYNDFYDSVCFLGGEPLEQLDALYDIASKSTIPNILYTGWLYNDIPIKIRKLMYIVIDGPYIDSLRTNEFPGSSNQKCYVDGELKYDVKTIFRKRI